VTPGSGFQVGRDPSRQVHRLELLPTEFDLSEELGLAKAWLERVKKFK